MWIMGPEREKHFLKIAKPMERPQYIPTEPMEQPIEAHTNTRFSAIGPAMSCSRGTRRAGGGGGIHMYTWMSVSLYL